MSPFLRYSPWFALIGGTALSLVSGTIDSQKYFNINSWATTLPMEIAILSLGLWIVMWVGYRYLNMEEWYSFEWWQLRATSRKLILSSFLLSLCFYGIIGSTQLILGIIFSVSILFDYIRWIPLTFVGFSWLVGAILTVRANHKSKERATHQSSQNSC